MMRKWSVIGAGLVLLALVMGPMDRAAWAAPQAQERPDNYSRQEYDDYIAASKEANAQQRVKQLDAFLVKYPNVSLKLLLPAYQTYYSTYYNELKDYAKVIVYVDKMMEFSDKIDAQTKFQALYLRTVSFNNSFNEKAANAREVAGKARAAAIEGLKLLEQLPKPEGVTDQQFAENKKGPTVLFNYTAGYAAMQAKDYKAAVDSFKAALAADPTAAVTYFRLGVAYLQMEPAQSMDGFWALARSVALKGPGEASVRLYLRNQLLRYQQTACDKLLDSEMNELIALAAASAERPASYTFASKADLDKAREGTTNFVTDLKAGGDKAKVLWLATCGLDFPEVAGKVIEINTNDSIVMKLYNGATQEEIEKATTPNMEVKVDGQPEAKRIQKDDPVVFAGTLVGYDPDPFMLHWEKAKIAADYLPEDKPSGKKPTKRPTKRPSGKPGI